MEKILMKNSSKIKNTAKKLVFTEMEQNLKQQFDAKTQKASKVLVEAEGREYGQYLAKMTGKRRCWRFES
jgi:hypothetical protein